MQPWLRKLLNALGIAHAGTPAAEKLSVAQEAEDAAAWVPGPLKASGYNADFSLESLREIDRFFDEQAPGGQPRHNGVLAEHRNLRVFAVGAYVGEVIRRQKGGQWISNDDDPDAFFNVAIRLGDGSLIWPIQRAFKRLLNEPGHGVWAEDSIYHYGLMTLHEPGESSEVPA